MYVMEHHKASDGYVYSHLHEMTAKEFAATATVSTENRWFRRCEAWRAHQHVKNGGIHSTPLWIDMDGRIRRA